MNISYKWLREYVDTQMDAQQVADALTSVGLEVGSVDEVQSIRGGLAGIVVGHVLTCLPHPDSDHMHVCTVDLGHGEPEQIVCGAPNVAAGQRVMVATIGTKLYDGDKEFTIKKSKLRGVESRGMICAEDEIGVGTSHDGIIVLPPDTPIGTPAAEYYGLTSDYVIEVDITPNRADACSHYGVARDLHAWQLANGLPSRLTRPTCDAFAVDNEDLPISVTVENTEACPRYCAVSLTGCQVTESPKWLRDRLTTIGLRPINNIVDITNYIMMAYGQPLHCFDADMVTGHHIVVKTMPDGTPFVTLDGAEHKLTAGDLAICNEQEPMCIAGIFGGKGSGTYPTTTNVVLESAYFHPTWIRKSARRHGLQTDASFRFERGIDPNGQLYALKQAALMARELAGAKVSMQVADVNTLSGEPFAVTLQYKYARELIGKDIPADEIKSILASLEIEIAAESDTELQLLVPPYRVDVRRPCDVVEDILRIYGYNRVEMPSGVRASLSVKGQPDLSHKMQNLVAEQLVGAGFREILNNSLQRGAYYADGELRRDECVELLNPLSQDLNVMRQTLLYGGLETIARNISHRQGNLRLFEFGNCYRRAAKRGEGQPALAPYSEELHLGLWMTGNRVEGSWAHPDEPNTVYELKAHALNILTRLGVPFGAITFDTAEGRLLIRNRSGKLIVSLGTVATADLKACGVEQPVYYADVDWTAALRLTKGELTWAETSKFPAVSRDLALLVDAALPFAQIERIAYQTEKKLLREVRLFDVYEGKGVPAGKKSYAVNFTLQDDTRTLTDKDIDRIMNRLIQRLTTELGAELR